MPDVYRWLQLDSRGSWRLKDEKISHHGLVSFINKHYTSDEQGRWYFQNGPQKVFVTLEYTPYVISIETLNSKWIFKTHNGQVIEKLNRVFIDDHGNFLVSWDKFVGVIRDTDIALVADQLRYDGSSLYDINPAHLEALNTPRNRVEKTSFYFALENETYSVEAINKLLVKELFKFDPSPLPEDGMDC